MVVRGNVASYASPRLHVTATAVGFNYPSTHFGSSLLSVLTRFVVFVAVGEWRVAFVSGFLS